MRILLTEKQSTIRELNRSLRGKIRSKWIHYAANQVDRLGANGVVPLAANIVAPLSANELAPYWCQSTPFMAFQLYKVNPEALSPQHINGGAYCFVEDGGKIIALGIKSLSQEEKPSDLKIHWQTFLAESGGTIIDNKINIQQLTLGDDSISATPNEVTVISKLRYAYALNYIQRVGISTSRIGLDYVS